ncbi:MAG: radical SAM protein [Trichloromonas sp.]|jgi:radical SAM superfamily enzyme YgiQ (UPF0313 family)|nr:radical SAM protein [Trichloromonas sp.]
MSFIVLVNPDIERLQERFGTVTLTKLRPQPPLGLCSIAATLLERGHSVSIVDGYAESLTPTRLADRVLEFNPEVVGFTVTCLNAEQAELTATLIKQRNKGIKIVFGGPQVTLQPQSVLDCRAVDFGVLGEGDLSFPQLVEAFERDSEPASIPGLILREPSGNVAYTKAPVPIESLDDLPFPARHLLNWSNYDLSGDYLLPAKKVFTISSSRGCPYRCTFCSSAVYWNCSYHARSANSVVDEIEILVREFGADGLNFREDNFMVDRKRVRAICNELLARKIKISWVCEARVDNVDRETLELMRDAGLVGLWCGVESGSPRILKQIRKGYTVEQVRSAFELFNDLGINTRAGFMIGFPDETEGDIDQTYCLAEDISPSHAYFQAYVAFPRGELYDEVVREKLYCDQWRDVYRVSPRNIPPERYAWLEASLREKFEAYKLKRNKQTSRLPMLGSRVLVFCTSGIAVIESVLQQIRKDNPDCILETLSNQSLAARIEGFEDVNKQYVYTAEHVSAATLADEWLQPLKEQHFDTIVITFSNGLGQGYEEVIEVAKSLRPRKLLSYNRLGMVGKIDIEQQSTGVNRPFSHDCELS